MLSKQASNSNVNNRLLIDRLQLKTEYGHTVV